MKKKTSFILFFILLTCPLFAQLDNPNSFVKFENIEDEESPPEESTLPAIELPSLFEKKDPIKNDKYANLGLETPQEISISTDDGFIENISNKAPKYFTKDKSINNKEYSRNQDLGDFKTSAAFVNVVYRDHEFVDGDRIRVFVNDDVIKPNVNLGRSFKGFNLPLQKGFNKIDFQALNQGTSGPNTAELHVYDDNGVLISAKRWNLTTGYKATIVIIKE
jgi:hypothetical protein